MVMSNPNWSEFTRKIPVKADRNKILGSWRVQDRIEKWFLSLAEFFNKDGVKRTRNEEIQPGDTYQWMWHGSDHVVEGEVYKNDDNEVEFTFLSCTVNVSVISDNGHNVLVVRFKDEDICRMY